jgi:hypothetical protein
LRNAFVLNPACEFDPPQTTQSSSTTNYAKKRTAQAQYQQQLGASVKENFSMGNNEKAKDAGGIN